MQTRTDRKEGEGAVAAENDAETTPGFIGFDAPASPAARWRNQAVAQLELVNQKLAVLEARSRAQHLSPPPRQQPQPQPQPQPDPEPEPEPEPEAKDKVWASMTAAEKQAVTCLGWEWTSWGGR